MNNHYYYKYVGDWGEVIGGSIETVVSREAKERLGRVLGIIASSLTEPQQKEIASQLGWELETPINET